jgi:hypothetical protein
MSRSQQTRVTARRATPAPILPESPHSDETLATGLQTTPAALLRVDKEDWIRGVRDWFRSLKSEDGEDLANPPKRMVCELLGPLLDDFTFIWRSGQAKRMYQLLFEGSAPQGIDPELIRQKLAYELQVRGLKALGKPVSEEVTRRHQLSLSLKWASNLPAEAFLKEESLMTTSTTEAQNSCFVVGSDGSLVGRYKDPTKAQKKVPEGGVLVEKGSDLETLSANALTNLFNAHVPEENRVKKLTGEKTKMADRVFIAVTSAFAARKPRKAKAEGEPRGPSYTERLREFFRSLGKKGATVQEIADHLCTTTKNTSVCLSIARNPDRTKGDPVKFHRNPETKLYHAGSA